MAFDKRAIAALYRKRARRYDLTANLYYLVGVREHAYRKLAVRSLALERGDTVVEVACGTGLNFPLLQRAVGPEGRIVGVDLTPEMLERARARVERNEWSNVELVRCDAESFRFPGGVGGVLSTFAITLMPGFEQVVRNGAAALAPGRRFAVVDFKLPESWPPWLVRAFVRVSRPFGVSMDLADRHPWESMERCLAAVETRSLYFGALYLCVGRSQPS